jgi:hypothetical protein
MNANRFALSLGSLATLLFACSSTPATTGGTDAGGSDPDGGSADAAPTPPTTCEKVEINAEAGNITSPTTWTAGKVYVVAERILVTSTLTIEPGVVVKFKGSAGGAALETRDSGKIIANGTADKRITLTSLADDSACGDTNGDGAASKPEKGDWEHLRLNGGTNHQFT